MKLLLKFPQLDFISINIRISPIVITFNVFDLQSSYKLDADDGEVKKG